jgi:hypothetical protein
MKSAMVAAIAAGAALAAAPGASAAIDRTTYECVGTGTWQVSINLVGQSYATRTLSAPAGACKKIHAGVTDDDNVSVNTYNIGDAAGPGTVTLTGAGVTGVQAFVGVATVGGTSIGGPVVIAGDKLDATLSAANATPWTANEVHTGTGSCGANCYTTKAVWIGSYAG